MYKVFINYSSDLDKTQIRDIQCRLRNIHEWLRSYKVIIGRINIDYLHPDIIKNNKYHIFTISFELESYLYGDEDSRYRFDKDTKFRKAYMKQLTKFTDDVMNGKYDDFLKINNNIYPTECSIMEV